MGAIVAFRGFGSSLPATWTMPPLWSNAAHTVRDPRRRNDRIFASRDFTHPPVDLSRHGGRRIGDRKHDRGICFSSDLDRAASCFELQPYELDFASGKPDYGPLFLNRFGSRDCSIAINGIAPNRIGMPLACRIALIVSTADSILCHNDKRRLAALPYTFSSVDIGRHPDSFPVEFL